jgi:hypothetical protein
MDSGKYSGSAVLGQHSPDDFYNEGFNPDKYQEDNNMAIGKEKRRANFRRNIADIITITALIATLTGELIIGGIYLYQKIPEIQKTIKTYRMPRNF